MKKKFAPLFIFSLWLLSVNAFAQFNENKKQGLMVYSEAIALFNSQNPTTATDKLALDKLLSAACILKAEKKYASILFDCYEKAGILKQTYGLQRQAVSIYKKAIGTCLTYKLSDSLLFKPYLYCGSSYYFLSLFDSSLYYLKESEAILLKFPGRPEAQRLFNSFGALYYEAGDYNQSINYFQKAIRLNSQDTHADKIGLLYGYKSNIASVLRKTGQYAAAISTYRSLIALNTRQSELFINLGSIYLERAQPDSALFYLARVKKLTVYDSITLENSLGKAYLQKHNFVTATLHLRKALAMHQNESTQTGLPRKSKNIGLTYKLLADVERGRHNLYAALQNYQKSIIQLDYPFNDSVIYSNPASATGRFRNYALFESLAAKATCLKEFYKEKPTVENRKGTIETYQATLKLIDYIEKSFDSEESQLFIIQTVFPIYQEAVAFLISSFEETKHKAYLEEAFRLAEKSKSVALYINLKENKIKAATDIPEPLLKKERDLKFSLSRLLIQIDKATTSQQAAVLTLAMQDKEIELSRLANKLLDYPDYRYLKFSFDSVNVAFLRKNLLRQQAAILSYFQTNEVIYCFVLTSTDIYYYKSLKDATYYKAINTLNKQLRTLTPGLAYQGHDNAKLLYDRLIKPAEPTLRRVSSVLIIPHNELSLLPFEILEDKNDRYLLEKFDITYQYAASFLQYGEKKPVDLRNTLAMAPFDSLNGGTNTEFTQLPASDEEINGLRGIQLRFRKATKENFLKFAGKASGIHLATHAVADNQEPDRSYIAFYAGTKQVGKLYAHELRNAPLANVKLIFLSACETASGKFISSEGVMSLSRGFSAAGCSNIVTSLWKAEDAATAYISINFYAYLKQGYNSPQALRKAKLDLLHDGQYAQFHSPQYWSHLVFIGIPDDPTTYTNKLIWGGGFLLLVGGTLWWWHYTKRRRKTN